MELGILEPCWVGEGEEPAEVVRRTIDLAARAEDLGYSRFWLTEHHSETAAHACPEMLLPALAARTEWIRIGTGGVLLRFYSPLKVAEDFRLLESLAPGRIDLGLARAGADDETSHALLEGRPTAFDPAAYARKIEDLLAFLREGSPRQKRFREAGPSARSVDLRIPEVWVLGSGTESVSLAAHFGVAFSFSLFLTSFGEDEDAVAEVFSFYRKSFRPSRECPAPRCSLALSGVCADSERAARRVLRRLPASPNLKPNVLGAPAKCREKVEALRSRHGIDEFLFLSLCREPEDRVRCLELLAGVFELPPGPRGHPPATLKKFSKIL